MRSRCSAELRSSTRFSILVRLTWMSASRWPLRSVSAAIFSSARASAVSRAFSVLVSALLRSARAARACSRSLIWRSRASCVAFDLRQPLFGVVAGDGGFDRFAVEGAHFLGAGDQVLPRLGQQPLGGRGARLQARRAACSGCCVRPDAVPWPRRARRQGGRVRHRLRRSSPRPCRAGRASRSAYSRFRSGGG